MTLKESLMTIKDFRIDRCKKHNLCDILMIVLIGYLTGCKDSEYNNYNDESKSHKAAHVVCTNLKWLAEKDEWKNLCGIGMVRSSRLTKDGESTELRQGKKRKMSALRFAESIMRLPCSAQWWLLPVESTADPTLKNSRYNLYKALHKKQRTVSQIYQ